MVEISGEKYTVSGWSLVPLQLTLIRGERKLASATGFCLQHEGRWFLVSAWHCLSGRNRYSHQTIDRRGAFPNQVNLAFWRNNFGLWTHKTFDLCDENEAPLWLEHPSLGSKVDLAVLPIELDEDLVPRTPHGKENATDMNIEVAMDVFIIGYPLGIAVWKRFPIWKRATIASDYSLDADGLPMFLVDTASRRGMSGAPVIARTSGSYVPSQGGMRLLSGVNTYTKFLGVYSGRIIPVPLANANGSGPHNRENETYENDSQLGQVWKLSALHEVLSQGRLPLINPR